MPAASTLLQTYASHNTKSVWCLGCTDWHTHQQQQPALVVMLIVQ